MAKRNAERLNESNPWLKSAIFTVSDLICQVLNHGRNASSYATWMDWPCWPLRWGLKQCIQRPALSAAAYGYLAYLKCSSPASAPLRFSSLSLSYPSTISHFRWTGISNLGRTVNLDNGGTRGKARPRGGSCCNAGARGLLDQKHAVCNYPAAHADPADEPGAQSV